MSKLRSSYELLRSVAANPVRSARRVSALPQVLRAQDFCKSWPAAGPPPSIARDQVNPLRDFFDARVQGRGIWKWLHYFDIYRRHLEKFVGTDAHVVEIGVYSGGSLDMWREYFGARARITGIDIAPECKAYEDERTSIAIGDQADRSFWAAFRQVNPIVDVVIDDGGHLPEQQIVTLEETVPHLRPGGVYICEDVHGRRSPFAAYVHELMDNLNESRREPAGPGYPRFIATPFQSAVQSITCYPYVVVIETAAEPVSEFMAPKHGTEWQPFLDRR